MKYLIIKCEALSDQYECDAQRTPICVIDDYTAYDKYGYDIYRIQNDGGLEKIRDWEDISEEYITYCEYDEDKSEEEPITIIRLKDGLRRDITRKDIEQWRQRFKFTDKVSDIAIDLRCSGAHGEQIGKLWCVIGEAFDNHYPTGI